MDFLKSILGDDLFSQVENKVNAYNSDEANKDKQIKIANLASQLSAANKVIEDLRKATKTDEDLQKKVTAYESKIQTLNEELKVTKTENALKFALVQAGAAEALFCLHYRAKKCKIISVIMIERGSEPCAACFSGMTKSVILLNEKRLKT